MSARRRHERPPAVHGDTHRLPLHAFVTDGDIIGEVVGRHGSRVHVLVGYVVTKWGRYGNVYESVEYGYGNYGAELRLYEVTA